MTARRDLLRRKLNNLLAQAFDEEFLTMCWATTAMQSGRVAAAGQVLAFPLEAATNDPRSEWRVHPWMLETLVNEVLTIPKTRRMLSGHRRLDCSKFDAMRNAYNLLHGLEDAEAGVSLKRVNVFQEMHRLAQRQIEWQRGFWTKAQLYRSAFIYGGPQAAEYFLSVKRFTFSQQCFAGLLFCGMFLGKPSITVPEHTTSSSNELLRSILDSITLPAGEARERARILRKRHVTASYKPSLLRTFPSVRFENRAVAPLPDLVVFRCTSGIFYDIVAGPQGVKNEVAQRFEAYCHQLLQAMLPGPDIVREFNYSVRKGHSFDTPDILFREEDRTSLICECKATRMSFEARFGDDPMVDADRAYREIAKGVFQIWRFVSHVRQGFVPGTRPQPGVIGLLLTLDTWLSVANDMQRDVLKLARAMSAESGQEILESDQVGIVFCPVAELELTLQQSTLGSFFEAVRAATEERFEGWFLSSVHRQTTSVPRQNELPFFSRMGEVLPWWNDVTDLRRRAEYDGITWPTDCKSPDPALDLVLKQA